MTYWTIAETAAAGRVNVATVYRHMHDGLLLTTKVGGRRLVPDDALNAWLRGDRAATRIAA